MIFETFQYMCIAAIGMLESERETNLDFINQNGVYFEVVSTRDKDSYKFGVLMSYGDKAHFECFTKTNSPESITSNNVISTAIRIADFVDQNRNIDQYDLVELKNRHHENN